MRLLCGNLFKIYMQKVTLSRVSITECDLIDLLFEVNFVFLLILNKPQAMTVVSGFAFVSQSMTGKNFQTDLWSAIIAYSYWDRGILALSSV